MQRRGAALRQAREPSAWRIAHGSTPGHSGFHQGSMGGVVPGERGRARLGVRDELERPPERDRPACLAGRLAGPYKAAAKLLAAGACAATRSAATTPDGAQWSPQRGFCALPPIAQKMESCRRTLTGVKRPNALDDPRVSRRDCSSLERGARLASGLWFVVDVGFKIEIGPGAVHDQCTPGPSVFRHPVSTAKQNRQFGSQKTRGLRETIAYSRRRRGAAANSKRSVDRC
jgi:hypothetical protein